METSDGLKTPRSFLKPATSSFPKILKFANKRAFFNPENCSVSLFVSRSFQFPYYTRKNGNFGAGLNRRRHSAGGDKQ
jgi:hypothetical protein